MLKDRTILLLATSSTFNTDSIDVCGSQKVGNCRDANIVVIEIIFLWASGPMRKASYLSTC